jgi:hypothetical protein
MPIRLINTGTLGMKVYMGQTVPPYAILSHTWVEDEEIDLQEMTAIYGDAKHSSRQKSGYQKIERTCELAAQHGIEHVWIDTCCIDKSSSAELSEAINSMFNWYRAAVICVAYLFDCDPSAYGSAPLVQSDLAQCRWFYRGWTLQELIAPLHLDFYDRYWRLVGSKSGLAPILEGVTGVPAKILTLEKGLYDILVAERMSWAANRRCTRIEDTAYCMLGIMDVNMPLLYGEGGRAFRRLQEEIIRSSTDLSIFCHDPLPARAQSSGTVEGFTHDAAQYIDLFAESPYDFHGSKISQFRYPRIAVEEYSVTNNGVKFAADNLRILRQEIGPAFHFLLLRHTCRRINTVNGCGLFLRKIGPGLFARVHVPTGKKLIAIPESFSPGRYSGGIHIATHISPRVRELIRGLGAAMRIQRIVSAADQSGHFWRITIDAPKPEAGWDPALRQFVTLDQYFEGSVRLSAYHRQYNPEITSCYLFCVNDPANRWGPEIWVRLVTCQEYDALLSTQSEGSSKENVLVDPTWEWTGILLELKKAVLVVDEVKFRAKLMDNPGGPYMIGVTAEPANEEARFCAPSS